MQLVARVIAEFLGTFSLTFAGCGSAVIAAAYPGLGIGFVGVALAFGLTVVTMAMPSVIFRARISTPQLRSGFGAEAGLRRSKSFPTFSFKSLAR